MTPYRLLIALMLLSAPVPVPAQDSDVPAGLDITLPGAAQAGTESANTRLGAGSATQPSRSDDPRVSVRVYGGWRQLWGGDINEAVENATRATLANFYFHPNEVDLAANDRGVEYGADLVFHLTPRFGFVAGIGLIESNSESLIEIPPTSATYPSGTNTALQLRAVPVRFGAQYAYPLGRRLSLLMEGGGGLYFTRLQWSDRTEVYETARITDLRSETSGFDFGLHGGISLDISVSERIGLIVGVQGVYANIGGLEGYREGSYTYQSPTRDDGSLKIVELKYSPDFPLLVVGEGTRTMDRYGPFSNEQEASVGLGGLRYTGGLRFSF